jgi:NACHT domain
MLSWLLEAGVGPAVVALPVNWAADVLAGAARRWFRRLSRSDDLSRLVRAATGTSVGLTKTEFDAIRQLLEDQQTWNVIGRGTVGDLAIRIADCLPPGHRRTADECQAAALAIARGLLEFVTADLDPKFFQILLLTRLKRMESDQANALDEALLGLNADLVARLDALGQLETKGVIDVMGHLSRVLDRLPPCPAQPGEIAVYLRMLIKWLGSDPWPQDRRLGGPVLMPAAIERKLRVAVTGEGDEQHLVEADSLAQQCRRLVILGGPGSGKTWLAKRTARRCAEDALEALAEGLDLDEVELPLFTSCSQLFGANGDIRKAVVSSVLDQLGDLGGSRLGASIRTLLTERNAPTLLVIDSLDEAQGSHKRLRQADTLPWRIVLTSRPSSWNHQLVVDKDRVGELQPLRYPEDVESFIQRWFTQRPKLAENLAIQIGRRPDLREAATVPLILTFYCIVGGGEPLPEFRHDLHRKVLSRLLTGRWRDSADQRPDVGKCLYILRAWAWSGATNHHVSGVGTWNDDVPAQNARLSESDARSLDHVATLVGPPDIDSGRTLRRFIHRSIREHLVAEHVASLPVDQAVDAILPHLWYDPDWEHSAPAAVAMHPDVRSRPLVPPKASRFSRTQPSTRAASRYPV